MTTYQWKMKLHTDIHFSLSLSLSLLYISQLDQWAASANLVPRMRAEMDQLYSAVKGEPCVSSAACVADLVVRQYV